MKKHCKILATVGPACHSVERLKEMLQAGVNLFRLNFSHGDHAYHLESLEMIREASRQQGIYVGVLQDISGPKVRIGKLKKDVFLEIGDKIEFVREEIVGDFVEPHHLVVSLNHPELLDKLKPGELIYLYDGIICARVVETGEHIIAEVISGGMLSSRKGVNFPNTRLDLDVLTDKDRKDIAWGVEHGVDFMAISFVQKAEDMVRVRALVESLGGRQDLIAKIEKFDAVENIDAILEESDGLMVARGDLGIEIPYYRVPEVQKMLIRKANEAAKPVITATQMLLSMTHSERATRAEISDVANAVLDGSDALMLSEESAIGEYPVEAVATMSATIKEAEKVYPYFKIHEFAYNDEMDVIDESAVNLVENIEAEAILAITSSGQSARKLSRYRPRQPIYAVTHSEEIARKLTLVWGVIPAFRSKAESARKMMIDIIRRGLEEGILKKESNYVVTAGDPPGVPGTTNIIRILRHHELEHFAKLAREKRIPEDWE
ncbi:pyruvate kinase [Nitratifractor salsuginis]|uniref:Pyruvate kinase n=1 Tax=Nitratifractor salsuginis (strain DSM 16511 / JCM 12458 / E9I37-1) TaxID=749222 RepID=E6X2F2_NITSE|nr:pyruvate kinase [Nitratifractor salsuginis]ADV47157.1 pyruvate kinase [Nitratifractor salsuginis DSM 16511]